MKTLAHQLVDKLWKRVGIPYQQFSSNLVKNSMDLIFEAAKVGNVEFLIILARSYPDLIWQQDEDKMSIFHIAILCRQESVFNLIFEIGGDKDSLASYATLETKENMLHLAGKLAPLDRLNIVSGTALQMQRELLWFKVSDNIFFFLLLVAYVMVNCYLSIYNWSTVGDRKDRAASICKQKEFRRANT
jgi:hypothetical protein